MYHFVQNQATVIKNELPEIYEKDEDAGVLEDVHVDLPGKLII